MTETSEAKMSSAANKVLVEGRVDTVRQANGVYFHTVLTPAASAYEQPQVVDVRSERPLADNTGHIKCQGVLEGYKRTFKLKDGSVGTSVTMWVQVK